jgi:putative FmdB family regulatory protein
MPLYEYECPEGHRFEKLQKLGEQEAVCPEHGQPGTKVFALPAKRVTIGPWEEQARRALTENKP